jgi:hypothetical protein
LFCATPEIEVRTVVIVNKAMKMYFIIFANNTKKPQKIFPGHILL